MVQTLCNLFVLANKASVSTKQGIQLHLTAPHPSHSGPALLRIFSKQQKKDKQKQSEGERKNEKNKPASNQH